MTEPPVEGFSGPPVASGSFAASGSQSAVPRVLAERARDLSDGRLTPAVPRDAATVILLRPGAGADAGPGAGPEAFLLRRTAELEFAPGACVFPGGSVDERDADPGIGWFGPVPEDFAAQLDVPPERARALVCAAIRETFEESGVLLAGDGAGMVDARLVSDSAALAADRHALLTGMTTLGEVLGRRGLVLRADLLTPWARWITPEVSPRRFDTWFFAAALPAGQTATAAPEGHADPGESESGTWLRPGAALEAAQAGEITLLPPTAVTLRELAAHQDVDGILACRRTITPRLPRVTIENGKVRLSMPPLDEESP
jgi:8-oxo-dGTP pyrophosphatase MutT (NUDIX family)